EYSLKVFRDNKNTFDYALETATKEGLEKGLEKGKIEGKIQGKIEGKIEVAKALKSNGISVEIIINATGLSIDDIEKF
ncbi:MAG: hypothetical protein EAZ06_11655, partial [Cytophagales bacterium]